MGRDETGNSFLDNILGKTRRRKPAEAVLPPNSTLGMLDRLHAGEHPDFCLYLRPAGGGAIVNTGPLAVDLEDLLGKALAPLPMVVLDEYGRGPSDSPLPDEAFLLLANKARILCLAPTADARFVLRLRIIKALGPLSRCIFLMPEAGTLGSADWPGVWPAAKEAVGSLGIELSGYTPGGWLFRIDKGGKAVTFRPIVNPNPEKIARALEGICGEME
ncbi:MAG TPA: hypothetical protein VFE47_11490 [Tepidisphaeraceae bacterium]|jgi:hypothetical protein|nr:hypothetical protein [Tepidisphaeraceae bacterium]